MINRTIAEYLKHNKRIVIPEVGTLIRRTDVHGSIIFMPLARRDDGVLAGLITQALGINEEEARKSIEEFVALLTAESQTKTGYTIKGVGTFRRDESGAIRLDATAGTIADDHNEAPSENTSNDELTPKADKTETISTAPKPETHQSGLTVEELSLRNELKKTLSPENGQSGSDGKSVRAQSELDKFTRLYEDEEDVIAEKPLKKDEPAETTAPHDMAQEPPQPAPKRKSDKVTLFATIIIIASLLLIGYGVYLEYSYGESDMINGMVDSVKSLFGE